MIVSLPIRPELYVFKLSCNDCDVVYIGETGRLLKQQTEEHRKDVDKVKVTLNVLPSCSVDGSFLQFLGCQSCVCVCV